MKSRIKFENIVMAHFPGLGLALVKAVDEVERQLKKIYPNYDGPGSVEDNDGHFVIASLIDELKADPLLTAAYLQHCSNAVAQAISYEDGIDEALHTLKQAAYQLLKEICIRFNFPWSDTWEYQNHDRVQGVALKPAPFHELESLVSILGTPSNSERRSRNPHFESWRQM